MSDLTAEEIEIMMQVHLRQVKRYHEKCKKTGTRPGDDGLRVPERVEAGNRYIGDSGTAVFKSVMETFHFNTKAFVQYGEDRLGEMPFKHVHKEGSAWREVYVEPPAGYEQISGYKDRVEAKYDPGYSAYVVTPNVIGAKFETECFNEYAVRNIAQLEWALQVMRRAIRVGHFHRLLK